MSLSPAILAMIDAAAAKHRARQIETKGWRSDAERRHVLVSLQCFWSGDIDDMSLEGRKAMVCRLDTALRAEHRRSQPSNHLHWTYQRSRHQTLLHAHRAETLAVQSMVAATRYLEAAE